MKFWYIISTFFYIGKFPIAPGTIASFATILIWPFISLNYWHQILILIVLFIIGIVASKKTSKQLNKKDPSEIVIDEVLGMGITLFMLPHKFILYAFAFILFRILDIFKPSFIYSVQKLPHGWGIILDDVFAGIFAWITCQSINLIL